jgi:glycosyltransferase involved in cell wall biosynthesis
MTNGDGGDFEQLIVCSLEDWDEVWRRNQFFVDALLDRIPRLRVLFVEPVVDVPYELKNRRRPRPGGMRSVRDDGRLFAARPHKYLPRVVAGQLVERHLNNQVLAWGRRLGFSAPVLWINDESYASLAEEVPWPTLHDMTDDWLAAAGTPRELVRRRHHEEILSTRAEVRVAVSPGLIRNRGASASIRLIPNGVDVEHFQTPQPRPNDVPEGAFVVYVGTLHEDRIDVDLLVDLTRTLAPRAVVLVGPNSLSQGSTRRLQAFENCHLLGPRPYAQIPAYYQHADVVIVPHVISGFTESLDPIKAYECIAVGRPTVSTPVAGFRELGAPMHVVDRAMFGDAVLGLLAERVPSSPGQAPTWAARALVFEQALRDAVRARTGETENPLEQTPTEP